jgi:(4-(4-[2-(gamma-L-glutamylamino)ethyl]phenoxymethyl)furan-2-yl)methanamine synthase
MTVNAYIGWDIGGAHLKVAHIDTVGNVIFASQIATPLWQGVDILCRSLEHVRNAITVQPVRHAVTTTAELVDIFPDRISGIKQLTDCITGILDKNSIQFFSGKSGWVTADRTVEYAFQIASANWYATASFLARHIDSGILLDIGSTTTDIVAFARGQVLNQGYSDYERLASGELVYTGIVRTPVMAVARELYVDGHWCPVVAEHFATMADVHRLTGDLQEEDDMLDTADGAGKTVLDSARRLARMVGKDMYTEETLHDLRMVARNIAQTQQNRIYQACRRVLSKVQDKQEFIMVGAGAGRFMVEKLAEYMHYRYLDFADILQVADRIKPSAARSATAIAVAQLARLSDCQSN